jgi:hypothetical protein
MLTHSTTGAEDVVELVVVVEELEKLELVEVMEDVVDVDVVELVVVVEELEKLELVEVMEDVVDVDVVELVVEALQIPKPPWQPVPQYASVEPLDAVSDQGCKTRDAYHQPYWLQQLPHWDPRQVCPLPFEAHLAFVVTVRLEEGEAGAEVAVEVLLVEDVVEPLQEP